MAWIDVDPRTIGRYYDGLPVNPSGWLDRTPRPFVLVYITNHGARSLISDMGYGAGIDYLHVG